MSRSLRAWLGMALVLACAAASAQDYPVRALKLVVPYPPGASADLLGRTVAQKMSQSLGQPVVVDNRAGASGNIGSEFVAKAAPDGYTFMIGTDATHAGNMHLLANPPFNPLRDFTALTLAVGNPLVLVVHPSLPATSVRELVDYCRAGNARCAYGSSGTGSPHHLAGELLRQTSGVSLVHVAYRGGAPAVTDLLGNQIPMVFSSLVTVLPHIRAGRLRAIAVTSAKRYPGLPDVPAVAETYAGFEMNSWLGFFAPANLPAPVAMRLTDEIVKALRLADTRASMDDNALQVIAGSSADFARQVAGDFQQRGQLIKAAGIAPE